MTLEDRSRAVDALYAKLRRVPQGDAAARAGDHPTTGMQRALMTALAGIPPRLMFGFSGMSLQSDASIDVDVLVTALHAFMERHDSTRTTFPMVGDEVVQRVTWPPPCEVRRFDATRGGLEESGAAARAEVAEGVELSTGPLLRFLVATIGPQQFALYVINHHIVFDAHSLGIFMRELPALYQAVRADKPSPLGPVPLQSGDVGRWERSWYADELPTCLAYWRRQLPERELPLSLRSMRRPPPDKRFFPFGRLTLALDDLDEALSSFATEKDATLAVVMLAAWKAVLSVEQDLPSVTVGVISSNRRVPTFRTFGFFATHLPIRTEIGPDLTFDELVRRVRDNVEEATYHEHIPHNIAVPPRPGESLRFRVFFNFINLGNSSPTGASNALGLSLVAGAGQAEISRDLDLMVLHGDGMRAHLGYNAELIDVAAAQELLDRYRALLRACVRDPARPLRELLPPR